MAFIDAYKMIEYRAKLIPPKPWLPHTGKCNHKQCAFDTFDYRINGIAFTENTEAFREEFDKYLIWKRLKNDRI